MTFLEGFSEWVDVSRSQSDQFASTFQSHKMMLSQRLQLERSGILESSSLLMEPNHGFAAAASRDTQESPAASRESVTVSWGTAAATSTSLVSSTLLVSSSTSLVSSSGASQDVAAVGLVGSAAAAEQNDSNVTPRGCSGKDFQLV